MRYFRQHLVEAIELNLSRRNHYSANAGFRGRLLSHLLVTSERLCLPIARYFDSKAKVYIERGIPVVKNDFIDMADTPDINTPLTYRGRANRATFQLVRKMLLTSTKQTLKRLESGNYLSAAEEIEKCILSLEEIEKKEAVHFAMVKHVLESAGLAAIHAHDYILEEKSIHGLCQRLVAIQIKLSASSLLFDRLAQACHEKDVGIVVNDVPPIPFLRELTEMRETKNAR